MKETRTVKILQFFLKGPKGTVLGKQQQTDPKGSVDLDQFRPTLHCHCIVKVQCQIFHSCF
jgi:hypothetical protein